MKKQILFTILLLCSALGFLLSLYLIENHYAPPTQGSFCDFGETISCSLVNTSVYSELFNVPVALLGALWFAIMFTLTWHTRKKPALTPGLVAWAALGTLSIIYFVIAELILQALCPLCTVVHLLLFIILLIVLSIARHEPFKKQTTLSLLRPWILAILLLFAVTFLLFNFPFQEKENYDAVAQCLNANGVKMYGSFRCGVCAKTRSMFGDSFQYIQEIECHPRGTNSQTQLCIAQKIPGTPTWVLEQNGTEIKRSTGFLSIAELRTFGGCS